MGIQNEQGKLAKPSSYLAGAIIVTILCCWPFGIPAIVNAAKVDNLWYSGHYAEAYVASGNAKTWIIVSMITGFIGGVLTLILHL